MPIPVPIGQLGHARVLRGPAGGSAALHGSFDRGPGDQAVRHRRAGEAGMQERWLMEVDPGGGDHLRGQLATDRLGPGSSGIRGRARTWRTPTRLRTRARVG